MATRTYQRLTSTVHQELNRSLIDRRREHRHGSVVWSEGADVRLPLGDPLVAFKSGPDLRCEGVRVPLWWRRFVFTTTRCASGQWE